jgi:isopentenyl diphosphate isomerase/L-lactate dehydrogenase-like FMN-dependent dehydrogenase
MFPDPCEIDRRRLLMKFLAASPALAYVALPPLLVRELAAQSTRPYAGLGDGPIVSPDHAIDVFDFEEVARKALPPAHWGYLATGTDDDGTIQANRDGFSRFVLRPRRLVDIRRIDMSTGIFGTRWPTPIVIAPTGSNKAFHSEGEIAVARAARAKRHLQILSTVSSTSVEDVVAARGEPVWFQLYARSSWTVTRAIMGRAERAGCPAVVITVDLFGGSNRLTVKRGAKMDSRACAACHLTGRRAPMHDGLDLTGQDVHYVEGLTWDFVRQVRDHTTMKVLIKGIVTAEDARLAVDHGVDGIVVSNHGGRAENSLRGTIECLPEVVEAVGGRILVMIDGGFRRGTDIFKALALGADAVCIGRPYLWGLASFGQAGVEAVLDILTKELEMVMKQTGATSIAAIGPAYVLARN